MKELIALLYGGEIAKDYNRLHRESVVVRYGEDGGLDPMSSGECYSAANELVHRALSNGIVCTKWPDQ